MWGKNSKEEILELNWTVLNLFSKLRHAMIRNTLDLNKGLPQGYSYVNGNEFFCSVNVDNSYCVVYCF